MGLVSVLWEIKDHQFELQQLASVSGDLKEKQNQPTNQKKENAPDWYWMPAIDSREGILCDFDFTSKKQTANANNLQLSELCWEMGPGHPCWFPQGEAAAWEETRAVCVCCFWAGLGKIRLGGYMKSAM